MDGATLAALVSNGYAIAAAQTGNPFSQYRPTGAQNPLSGPVLATLPVTVSADSYRFRQPIQYGKPLRQILVDTSQTAVGDYLVSPTQTLFIADQSPRLPVQAVLCNAIVSVRRPQQSNAVGALSAYGGDVAADEMPVLNGFPCSLIQGTKGERGDVSLPGDTRSPWWTVLLPAPNGIAIEIDDLLVDAAGTRYVVSSAELSALGWRLTAMEAVA